MKPFPLFALCFVLSCLLMTAANADKLYTWVDSQGKVHYSQTPPPSVVTGVKAVDIHVTQPDPAAVQAAQAQAAQQKPGQSQAPQAPPPPDPQEAARLQRCSGMHAQLSAYTHSDAAPTSERTEAIADLKSQIAKECG